MIRDFGGGYFLRHATAADHDALSMVCLRTGDAGADATAREDDPALLGLIYAVPYQVLEPDLAFAVDGPAGVCGYLFGALNTGRFNERLAAEWYPKLQERVADPGPDRSRWKGSDWARRLIYHPDFTVPPALGPYPSHAHIDLLPAARGRGIGRDAMGYLSRRLFRMGSRGMHLQVNADNAGGLLFYAALGFEVIRGEGLPDEFVYVGKRFGGVG